MPGSACIAGNNSLAEDNDFSEMLNGAITCHGCDYRIELERTNDGTLSSGFGAGGLIRAS